MDRIADMLGRLGELDPTELDELENSVLSEFDSVEKQDPTRDIVDRMNQLADAAEAIRGERTRRDEEAAELSSARDAATARVRGGEEVADADEDGEELAASEDEEVDEDGNPIKKKKKPAAEAPGDVPVFAADDNASVDTIPESEASTQEPVEAVAAAAEGDAEPDVSEAPEADEPEAPAEDDNAEPHTVEAGEVVDGAVAEEAAAEPDAQETVAPDNNTDAKEPEATVTAAANEPGTIEVPADRRPAAKTAPVAITAGADIPGVTAGSPLPDMKSVANAIVKRLHAMGRTSGGDGEQHTIASIVASFPEDRTLYANDFDGNSVKVANVVTPQAITAAGGICAPVEVRYDLFGLGDRGRPVRDSLAVFSADRGGIRFVTPPVLDDLNGAVSVWTLQDDIDAATAGAPDPVKPCIRVNCGAEVVVYTDAIPLCLTFGNLNTRAYPELVERHTELGMIWHDRFAETRLLTRIGALSTAVTAANTLGAVRDFFVTLEKAAAGYRNRHRMAADSNLRVMLPEWFKNMLRADLAMQLPGDGGDNYENTIGIAEAKLNAWFGVRHINVTWFIDGEAGQIMGAQSAGAVNDFPTTLVWYLFSEGTFLFLDGGTLDLGLVRDSTLNGTNDYKIFLETFEGVAKIGIESLRVTSTLKVNGATAGTVDTVA